MVDASGACQCSLCRGERIVPEREAICAAAALLARRVRELASKIANDEADLAKIREETSQITEQWNSLIETLKAAAPPEFVNYIDDRPL